MVNRLGPGPVREKPFLRILPRCECRLFQFGCCRWEPNSNLRCWRDMKLQSSIFRNSLFVVTLILALPAFRAAAQTKPASTSAAQAAAIPASITQARITQAIDETQLVRLRDNVHPLARPEFDRGPVSDATPMDRMLLLLQHGDRKSTRLNSSHLGSSYAVFCLKKK